MMSKSVLLFFIYQLLLNDCGHCKFEDLDSFISPIDIDLLSLLETSTSSSHNTPTAEPYYQKNKNIEEPSVYGVNSRFLTDIDHRPNEETTKNHSSTASLHSQYLKEINLNDNESNEDDSKNSTDEVECFGFRFITRKLRWILNLKPQESHELQTDFYFSSRTQRKRVQVIGGDQFGLEWVSYNPKKPTIVIVHGFLSYSAADWVVNMTNAFLSWGDVNVISVDWSRGGNTWKYWRAVANTRTVGTDLANFLGQLIEATNASTKDFHFVGHSLGAHICSYASDKLGGVRRITGLDPAQPCFKTTNSDILLDKSDAEFVDVIHTNGRLLSKLGLGVQHACGHQDFYPNGGMKQPGCHVGKVSLFSKIFPISLGRLKRAVCNHGRAYLLFTESLKKSNCSLIGHVWDRTYNGANDSVKSSCKEDRCSKLGIDAVKYPARGSLYVVTSSDTPYCDVKSMKLEMRLLSDIKYDDWTTPKYEVTNPPKRKSWFSIFG